MRLLALIVGVLLVGGCSATVPDALSPAGAPTTGSAPAPAAVAEPVAISIPAIGVESSLIAYGLNGDGSLAVPPVDDPGQAGYYGGADPAFPGDEYLPGEPGPAVVMGHVDGIVGGTKGEPGVFFRLSELAPGNDILIDRKDGSQARFVVDRVERHEKDDFPTAAVYSQTPDPELRLITCGGAFDRAAGHYTDNVVVFAQLAPDQP